MKREISKHTSFQEKVSIVHAIGCFYVGRNITLEESCKLAEISYSTLDKWRTQYPEIEEIITIYINLKSGLTVDDAQPLIENQLMKHIMGFEISEEEVVYDGEGNVIQRKVKTKQHPGDPKILMWLMDKYQPQTKHIIQTKILFDDGTDSEDQGTEITPWPKKST